MQGEASIFCVGTVERCLQVSFLFVCVCGIGLVFGECAVERNCHNSSGPSGPGSRKIAVFCEIHSCLVPLTPNGILFSPSCVFVYLTGKTIYGYSNAIPYTAVCTCIVCVHV